MHFWRDTPLSEESEEAFRDDVRLDELFVLQTQSTCVFQFIHAEKHTTEQCG